MRNLDTDSGGAFHLTGTEKRNKEGPLELVVRRLKPSDEARVAHVAASFKAAQCSTTRASRFLSNPANYLIVAERGDELLGFVLAYRLERLDREAAQLFVYEVGVTPRHRRSGIGARLMEYVRDVVAEESLLEAFVLTDQDNDAAVRLYRGTGGQVEGGASVLFIYPGQRGVSPPRPDSRSS